MNDRDLFRQTVAKITQDRLIDLIQLERLEETVRETMLREFRAGAQIENGEWTLDPYANEHSWPLVVRAGARPPSSEVLIDWGKRIRKEIAAGRSVSLETPEFYRRSLSEAERLHGAGRIDAMVDSAREILMLRKKGDADWRLADYLSVRSALALLSFAAFSFRIGWDTVARWSSDGAAWAIAEIAGSFFV